MGGGGGRKLTLGQFGGRGGGEVELCGGWGGGGVGIRRGIATTVWCMQFTRNFDGEHSKGAEILVCFLIE